jgi:flagellar basal body-associated protein FliL
MTATPMPPAPESAQPKKSRTWLIILIVVLVLCCLCAAVGGGIWWLWSNGDKFLGTSRLMLGLLMI